MKCPIRPIRDVGELAEYLAKRLFGNPTCHDCAHYQGTNSRGFYLCDLHFPGEPGSDAWGRDTCEPCPDFRPRRYRAYVILEFEGGTPEEVREAVRRAIRDLRAISDLSVWVEPTDDKPRSIFKDAISDALKEACHTWEVLLHKAANDVHLDVRAVVYSKGLRNPGKFTVLRGNRRAIVQYDYDVEYLEEAPHIPGLEGVDLAGTGMDAIKAVWQSEDGETWEEWGWSREDGRVVHLRAKRRFWTMSWSAPWFL